MKPLLRLQEIQYAWPGQKNILDIESFEMSEGEKVLLQGPSGSGKSTLLNLVGGVLLAQRGELHLLDQNLNALSSEKRDRFRGDHLGFIFQQFNLLPFFNAIENVTLTAEFSEKRKKRVLQTGSLEKEAERLLSQLGLEKSLFTKKVNQLSVGQQQRVATARALLGSPELIIADEPTSALDAQMRDRFLELLFQESQKTKTAVLFVSHDPALSSHFDRTVLLSEINRGGK